MIYFLIYLFAEIYLSLKIGSAIGPLWTFVEVVLSALYGVWIIANMHTRFGVTLQALARGEITMEEFERLQLYSFLGAILLIVPGFLSDILGILLQFAFVGKLVAGKFFKPKKEVEDVIDVEIVER